MQLQAFETNIKEVPICLIVVSKEEGLILPLIPAQFPLNPTLSNPRVVLPTPIKPSKAAAKEHPKMPHPIMAGPGQLPFPSLANQLTPAPLKITVTALKIAETKATTPLQLPTQPQVPSLREQFPHKQAL